MTPVPSKRDQESSSSAPPLAARLVEPPLAEDLRFFANNIWGRPNRTPWEDGLSKLFNRAADELDRLQAGRLVDPSPLAQLSEKKDDQARVDKGINRHGLDLPQPPTE